MSKHWTETLYPTERINICVKCGLKTELKTWLGELTSYPSFDRVYNEYCDNKYWELVKAIRSCH